MSKTIKILLAVLVVQIGFYLAVSQDRHRVRTKQPFLTVDTSEVNYIKIVNEDGELVMNRVGNQWKMKKPIEYPANQSYVRTLLEKLARLRIETEVTTNPDKFPLYELDELGAKYVEVGATGSRIDSFYCGKTSESYTHTYLRRAGSNHVLLVSGTPRSSFTRKPEQWRDKKILALDRSLIEQIDLEFPDQTVELVRRITTPQEDTTLTAADTSWTAIPEKGGEFEPDKKVMNRILNTLKRLNAIDFIDQATGEVPDFSHPDFTVEVHLEGDQHEKIEFIPKPDNENRWIARRNEDDSTVFVVYKSSVNNLKKDPNALKGKKDEK